MPDYSKSIIYTIRSKDNIYVGSTLNFRARKCQHKNCMNNENSPKYNVKLYKTIRQNAGEWDMKAHSIFPCNSKLELTIEEERIRQLLNADMNMKSCGTGLVGLTKSEHGKQYYEQHRDEISEQKKQYREQNRDELIEKSKQYYDQHKDEHNEKMKQYYEQHRDEIREKRRQRVTCECGCDVNKYYLSVHCKTTKHILGMEKLNQ